jgi:hypothetical protein
MQRNGRLPGMGGAALLPSFSVFERSNAPTPAGTECVGGRWCGLDAWVQAGLFLSLPLGNTEVVGGMGLSDTPPMGLGGELSFLGFFASFSVRWSPFAMWPPDGFR